MKRSFVLMLVLLLILSGCTGKGKLNDISVKDVCCPYEITHNKGVVEIVLRDGEQRGILWHVKAVPEDICEVTEESVTNEYTSRYCLSGKAEGIAQLTFTAQQADETILFILTLVANVDAEGKTVISSYQHQEREDTSVEADGLNYKWNVDVDGILNFTFIDSEDNWSVNGDEEGPFAFSNMMSTPNGCIFSARAKSPGQTTIVLVSKNTQRTIHVVIQADDKGKVEVISVQEQ